MAVRDFTANQIRTAKIIMTGSATQGGVGHKNLDLSVYSESVAPNELGGNPSPNPYTDVGEEVAIFVSGAVSYSNRAKDNTHVLFNGNLGTSGSMHFMNAAPLTQATLNVFTKGNANAAHASAAGQKITLTSTDGTTKSYVLVDPALSDSDTTATTHTPLAANSILGANATVTGVKAVVDNALNVTTTASTNEVVFNVPTTAGGESGTVSIRILDTLIAAQANVIQVKRTGGAVAPIHLIKAINGDSDVGNIVYGTGRGTSGIAGITASAGSHGSGQQIKLTLDRPGDHTVSITNGAGATGGSIVANPGADYFASGGGAVTAGTAGDIAVILTGDQATVLNAIRAAVLSSNGHTSSKISASAAAPSSASPRNVVFTQTSAGADGNTVVAENIEAIEPFTGGFSGGTGLGSPQTVYVYADHDRPKHLYLSGSLFASGSRDQNPGGTISGSIHHTRDGLSYLVGGTNVTIVSSSNGQVTINSSGGGGGGGGNSFTTIALNSGYSSVGSWGASNNQVADSGTDTLTLVAGTNITIEGDSDAASDAIKISAADTNTQLSQEQVEDFVGAMVSGNTETGISVSYADNGASAGKLDFVVSDLTVAGDSGSTGMTPGDTLTIAGGTNCTTAMSVDTLTINATDTNTQLTQEQVEDIAGPLVASGGTKTGITVTYDDANGDMDFVVSDTIVQADTGGNINVTPGETLAIKGLTNLSTHGSKTGSVTTVNIKSDQLVASQVFSPEGGLQPFKPNAVPGVNDKMVSPGLYAVGANNEIGDGFALGTGNPTGGIKGIILRTQVPRAATKVQLTTCFQALGSASSRFIEFLVAGRKWEQIVSGGSVAANAKENTTGKNRWADEGDQHGTAQAADFQSGAGGRWRGYTSDVKTNNKIAVNEGDNLYIVPSRQFSLSGNELRNSASGGFSPGDVLDIAIGRNRADAQNVVGSTEDTGSADQNVVIYWVKVEFLE